MINLGARLKKVRETLGFGQKAFGKEIGVAGRDTISRWERGLGFPSANILANMRQKFRINLDWLISGEGEPFVGEKIQEDENVKGKKVMAIDPVVQLLNREEGRAGVSLRTGQRAAILRILRELVDRDVRSIRELLHSMPGVREEGDSK